MPDNQPINRTATIGAVIAIIVALAVAAALLDLGPFSDDEPSTPTTAGGSFVSQGDAICSKTQSSFGDQQQGQPKTGKEAAQITGNLVDLAQSELDQIRQLTPPPASRAPLKRYLKAREEGIALLKKGQQAAEKNDFDAYGTYQAKVAAGQRQRQRLAEAVGFSQCSQPSLDHDELAQQAKPPKSSSLDSPNEVGNPPGPP